MNPIELHLSHEIDKAHRDNGKLSNDSHTYLHSSKSEWGVTFAQMNTASGKLLRSRYTLDISKTWNSSEKHMILSFINYKQSDRHDQQLRVILYIEA